MVQLMALYSWVQLNGAVLISAIMAGLTFLEFIVRLTPTDKDDGAVERAGKFIRNAFDVLGVPNKSKDGTNHPPVKDTI
jgi:hypothetical protein